MQAAENKNRQEEEEDSPSFTPAELAEAVRGVAHEWKIDADDYEDPNSKIIQNKLDSAARRLEWIEEVEKGLESIIRHLEGCEANQDGDTDGPVRTITTHLLAKLREI